MGSALSGTLEINVSDDPDFLVFIPEVIVFVIEEFDFDTGGLTFGTAFAGDLEIGALAALNTDGLLEVTVQSVFGDFFVGDSTLTVVTADVPTPETLGLLGLGLLSLAFARRARAS